MIVNHFFFNISILINIYIFYRCCSHQNVWSIYTHLSQKSIMVMPNINNWIVLNFNNLNINYYLIFLPQTFWIKEKLSALAEVFYFVVFYLLGRWKTLKKCNIHFPSYTLWEAIGMYIIFDSKPNCEMKNKYKRILQS